MRLPGGRWVGAGEERVREKGGVEFDCVGMILGGVVVVLVLRGAQQGRRSKAVDLPPNSRENKQVVAACFLLLCTLPFECEPTIFIVPRQG